MKIKFLRFILMFYLYDYKLPVTVGFYLYVSTNTCYTFTLVIILTAVYTNTSKASYKSTERNGTNRILVYKKCPYLSVHCLSHVTGLMLLIVANPIQIESRRRNSFSARRHSKKQAHP